MGVSSVFRNYFSAGSTEYALLPSLVSIFGWRWWEIKRLSDPRDQELHWTILLTHNSTISLIYHNEDLRQLISQYSQQLNMLCIKLALALSYSAIVLACSLDCRTQHPDGFTYEYDCKDANDYAELTMCLLQRNTLNEVMQCTEYGPNHVFFWKVDPGSIADQLDLIPPPGRNNEQAEKFELIGDDLEGYLKVTPRGLIYAASQLQPCQHCGLTAAISICPHKDHEKFRKCLCCQLVNEWMIKCLEDCIYRQQYGYFGRPEFLRAIDWQCSGVQVCQMEGMVDGITNQVKVSVSAPILGPEQDKTDSMHQISKNYNSSSVQKYPDCDLYKVENWQYTCYSEDDDDGSFTGALTIDRATSTWSRMSSYIESAPTGSVSNVYRNGTATGTPPPDGAAETYYLNETAKATPPGVSTLLAWAIAGILLFFT